MKQDEINTLGPWTIRPGVATDVVGPDGRLLATAYPRLNEAGYFDENGLPEAEANARLMALSLELRDEMELLVSQVIDACGAVSEFCMMPCPSTREKLPTTVLRLKNRVDAARTVLAKAKGPIYAQQFGRGPRVKTDMTPILDGLPVGEEP